MTLTFWEAFAGIGGFHLGFTRAGMASGGCCEILPTRQHVLRTHFGDIEIQGDINAVEPESLGRPDLAVAGFPCDGISKAQVTRSGLADPRSGQYVPFARLLGRYLSFVAATHPRWLVLENPDGILTSPGRPPRGDGVDRTGWDLAAVSRSVEDLGYSWAYRVVDGRWFGTPQKRLRTLLVGHLGRDPRPALQVLADVDPGEEVPASSGFGGRPRRGPHSVLVGSGDRGRGEEVLIWRKSSNPRASLAKGGYETWVAGDFANTLTGFDWGDALRQKTLIAQGGRLRTLTITEWERLAGFPDGWTLPIAELVTRGNGEAARADALGDSMLPGMAEWLGRRIVEVDRTLPQIHAA